MAEAKQSCDLHGQNDQHAIQDAEIREKLGHIKNRLISAAR